ncbi:restriction endonuclease subunit S [Lactobacillus delbrueckii]|uniref:restriction endonuclease subunit S n=1 Tax=Lactobacillus delbrueckii TaxID=1584 RepID=UPI0022E2214B|nr:restriction endonuclease subunit S [Lactobacillus delbrueckii]
MKFKLSEIFNLQMGKTPSRHNSMYWNDGNREWISISDISGSKYISNTKEKITEKAIQDSGIKKIPANTVIMSFKLSIGKVAITSKEMYSNEAIMAFIDKKKVKLLPEYVYYLLMGVKWDQNTNKAVMGKTLNKSTISQIIVDVDDYEIQKQKAEALDFASKQLDIRNKEIHRLDTLVKARFVEMFGDPCCNQLNWKCKKLNEITSKIGSGATPKGGKESYVVNGVSFVRSLNVYDGNFVYKNLAHLTQEQASQLQNVTLEKDDVLINITGASVARSCIVPNDILPARVNQHVSILRPNLENVNPVFLNQLLISYNFKNKLLNLGSAGGATRQAITKQQLEDLEIILPPIELQNQFASFVQQVDKSKVVVKKISKFHTISQEMCVND